MILYRNWSSEAVNCAFAYPKSVTNYHLHSFPTIPISDNVSGPCLVWSERTEASRRNLIRCPNFSDLHLSESRHQDNRISGPFDNLISPRLPVSATERANKSWIRMARHNAAPLFELYKYRSSCDTLARRASLTTSPLTRSGCSILFDGLKEIHNCVKRFSSIVR